VLAKKTLFLIYCFVFRVMSLIFAAQCSTNLAQFSTNFIFIFLQNGGANFTHISIFLGENILSNRETVH